MPGGTGSPWWNLKTFWKLNVGMLLEPCRNFEPWNLGTRWRFAVDHVIFVSVEATLFVIWHGLALSISLLNQSWSLARLEPWCLEPWIISLRLRLNVWIWGTDVDPKIPVGITMSCAPSPSHHQFDSIDSWYSMFTIPTHDWCWRNCQTHITLHSMLW